LPEKISDSDTIQALLPELRKIRNFCRCFVEEASLKCPLSQYAVEGTEKADFRVKFGCFLSEAERDQLYKENQDPSVKNALENLATEEIKKLQFKCKKLAQEATP